ncbi:tyrosine-protein phosphatase non-receptor type 12-like isoform X1 [Mercenaria mercenaria]|uniref:tyrosine-protein phosphatase non-receptor type 12-like isoform X1 n=1 Tax=Mercenaria mercenaria TaxID=6596 RepID=UPI00234F2505|nr:tyrosine-protein phosphatase non-receptor type 12-like isoform X1 [Mercenaria mercenaria]
MEPDDVVESTLRLQKCLQTFIYHVDELREEDDPSGDGFTREFRVIRDEGMKMREENTYPAEEGRRSYNIKKNRYKDILPFDKTRVVLDEIPGEDGSDYINANFIEDQYGARCYIASQGPVPNTVYDFWRMAIQYKVKVIAMACRLVEMGKRKCEQYWPDEVNETAEYKDVVVTLVSQEDLADHLTKRVLKASRPGYSALTVTQFHYTGWPDHDIPNDFDVILEMMAEMREIKSKDSEKAPMVIHCSAGCGRTGTICAIDFSWDLLKSGNMDDNFSLCDIVKYMRTQRQSMIQAPEQYMMAHVTVQTLFQKHLDLMEDHTYGNIGFGDANEDDSERHGDGSASEAGSESSSLYEGTRKRSVMAQDIVNTIKKVTHTQTQDELLTPTNPTGPVPDGLPEPLTPVPAVYISPEPVVSPKINELKKTFSNENKTFKVEKIDMPKQVKKVEARYLENATKIEKTEKKMSFVSNEARQKEIESKKAMFEKPKITEKPHLEPMFEKPKITEKPHLEAKMSFEKPSSVIPTPLKEKNNNQPVNMGKPEVNNERQQLQRVESQQTGNKFVTVLSVGGTDKRPPLNKTVSSPATQLNATRQSVPQRSKTLSVKKTNQFEEKPQSSIPPETPPTQREKSMYSVAGNSQFYSALADYSSAPTLQSSSPESATNVTVSKNAPNNQYSALSNYTSATSASYDPYSSVDENPGDVTLSKPQGETTPSNQGTQVYSYADEPLNTAGAVYAAVDKPMRSTKKMNGAVNDAVYEPVTVGSPTDKTAPVLPARGYIDDDENQNVDKSGAGDTNTLGKKAQLTSAIKNLFTGKGINSSASDHIVPSDIPGYKIRLGKKPSGPKEQPSFWKKK